MKAKSLEKPGGYSVGKSSEYDYPVCFDFPVGHQKNNFALKCGIMHQLNVYVNECTLTEIK